MPTLFSSPRHLHINDSTSRSVGTLKQPSSGLIFGALVAPLPCSAACGSWANEFARTERTFAAPSWLNRAVSLHYEDIWQCNIRACHQEWMLHTACKFHRDEFA